jgi:hypothetical protein
LRVAVEAPFAIDHADFEEHARVGAVLLEVEEALLGRAADIRPEDDFPGEGFHARQRMDVQEKGVLDAAKLDGFAGGRRDDSWMSFGGDRVPADLGNAVELPHLGRCLRAPHEGRRGDDDYGSASHR